MWAEFQDTGSLYVFQTRQWLEGWYEAVGRHRGVRPCLAAVYDDDDSPSLFFPFQIEESGRLRTLVWFGGELIDYGAPVIGPGRVDMIAAWMEVLSRIPPVDLVRLPRIPETINNDENPMLALECREYHSRAHYVELEGEWEEFYQGHAGSKTRSTDRRKERRLRDLGTVEVLAGVPGEDPVFDEIALATASQKSERYRVMRAPDIMERDGVRDFFEKPAAPLRDGGILHLSAVSLDGELITTHWGMRFGDRFYYYMPSYAEGTWMKYSPGRLLLFQLFEWCFDNGVKFFDFTIGDESYKKDWCDREIKLYNYIEGLTAGGKAAAAAHRAGSVLLANRAVLGAARRIRKLFHS